MKREETMASVVFGTMASAPSNFVSFYMKNLLTAGIKKGVETHLHVGFSPEASICKKKLSIQRRRLPSIPVQKSKPKTIRRGRKKSKTKNEVKMHILGSNAAGILNKTESLKDIFHCLILECILSRNPKCRVRGK